MSGELFSLSNSLYTWECVASSSHNVFIYLIDTYWLELELVIFES